ncbi:hypothetical protein ACYOEI_27555 [Singulisphaera rosea]
MRRFGRVLRALVVVAALSQVASACPNCKEAVAAQPSEVAGMQAGYNWSVLFMIAVPFTLMGTGSFMVARAVKHGAMPEL